MNKKELLDIIENIPDDMDIFINQTNHNFAHSLLECVKVNDLKFIEGHRIDPSARQQVLILTDDI